MKKLNIWPIATVFFLCLWGIDHYYMGACNEQFWIESEICEDSQQCAREAIASAQKWKTLYYSCPCVGDTLQKP